MTEKEREFLEGLVISAACASLPVRKKYPTAYSYNGVILPALPEWDREMYPYAAIYKAANEEVAYLYVMEEPCIYGGVVTMYSGSGSMATYHYEQGSKWNFIETKDSVSIPWYLDWSNFDVLDKNDAVHLEASEPVPVYE